MERVGVIGCGTMGSGITQVCAQAGYEVLVSEANNELLNKGLAAVDSSLLKAIEKGKLSPDDKNSVRARIKGTVDKRDFYDCDLVIEAAPENMELKRQIFSELDNVCPKHAILATNTSSLSVIDIATATTRTDKVLGLHFFNPVPAMKLLEVVKTIVTSDETLETGKEFGKSIGKTVIVAPDVPGFILNRLMAPLGINAIRMLEDGIATKEDIDNAMKLGANMPMGRLELADLIGLDTLLAGYENLYQQLKDPRYAPPLLLKKMVAAGWLGRKSGKGFYEYKKED
ncbi:MAG: 3-hydroxybutyryl-CoA dehydrogenase [Dehalococcoidia bacterium]|nr:3-hydroxybutyryl-CoA dehydrogenase [Dehalococcoidia bacterium]